MKFKLALILFILGFAGVLSMLTMDIPLPEQAGALLRAQFSETELRFFLLINPALMLLMAVLAGALLYDRVGLRVPLLEGLLQKNKKPELGGLFPGVLGGIAAGSLILLSVAILSPYFPGEYKQLGEKIKPGLAVRFLYGGITEELLMRFGLMTFLVWLCTVMFKGKKPIAYLVPIILTAFVFAIGHLPVVYGAVASPPPHLVLYILLGNSVGGLIFGWLYWKKGLESAIIAHIFTHVVLVSAESLNIHHY